MTNKASERIRLQKLLALGVTRVHNIVVLNLDQQCCKAFVDRHRGRNEEMFSEGKAVLVFQTHMGKMLRKLCF